MTLTIGSDLAFRAKEDGCVPVMFVPDVDPVGLNDESIIQAF